jgi:glycosyltransferase involved in cell wall biosynthesis
MSRALTGRRVCMFVFNACTTDSRVLREAASLHEAGADVTIVAQHADGIPDDEVRDGVRIRRVSVRPHPRRALDRPDLTRAPEQSAWLTRARARATRLRQRGLREIVDLLRYRIQFIGLRLVAGRSMWVGRVLRIWIWYRASRQLGLEADIYHGHDLIAVVPAWAHARRQGVPLIYDSHEIYLESGPAVHAAALTRWTLGRIERAVARRARAVITVNPSVARELAARLGVPEPTVVMNCPPRWLPESAEPPRFDHFRRSANLPIAAGSPIVLYQGGFTPHRGIEVILRTLDEPELTGAVAVFLGYGALREWLVGQAARPGLAGRVFVVDAVPPDALLEWTASADVTGAPIERSTLNHWLSTPNKVFESLAAGVPVVASDFPEMARIVRETGAGTLCDPADVRSVAAAFGAILGLTDEARLGLRQKARRAALDRYNWETEARKLLDIYERILA